MAKGKQAKKREGLSPRQLAFARAYLKDPIASKAAVAAGYSKASAETNGPRLLRNAQVRAFIDAATKKAADRAVITKAEVLTGLKREALGYDEDADTGPKDATANSRVTAWVALGKSMQMFADKEVHEHNINIRVIDPYSSGGSDA